jgi:AbrB family looped-hinge helix DNA binding protein
MAEATVTSKGQVTIPKTVRDALGLQAGDRVDFVESEEGFVIVPAKRDLRTLRGVFKGRRKKPLSTEEMNAVIAEMGRR